MKHLAILIIATMATVSIGADNMVRGFQFDGATNLMTGADLEDLVTKATFTTNAFDSSNATGLFDGNTIDADTNNRAKVATGGIGTLEIEDRSILAADIAVGGVDTDNILNGTIVSNDLSAALWAQLGIEEQEMTHYTNLVITKSDFAQTDSNITTPFDIAAATFDNCFDGDTNTFSSTMVMGNSGSGITYCDLGSIYRGYFVLQAVMNAGSVSFTCAADYSEDATISIFKFAPSMAAGHGVLTTGSTDGTAVWIVPFSGRYLGLWYNVGAAGSGTTIKISEFQVYGKAGGAPSLYPQ